ncbi:MAG TPA: DegT/DnrJ/EryC1/StrS family aminotransferase, partial [Candidatus Tectomicrobia bacterium]
SFIGGPHVRAFEEAFATFCEVKHCIGVGNGTDALFIALKSLGIGGGDEVITAANSFIATSEAITATGAQVVFCDIDPHTYNIDVSQIEAKITPRTKAIIPVHLYGQPADMDPIMELARRYGLKIIEDAAQAHGARYKGQRAGSLGDVACFSFYPGKNLGAYGDAGALVTNDDALALNIRMFANHGRVDKYDHKIEGMNSRLDGLQAAILNVKLKHLEQWTESRRQLVALYNELLASSDIVTPMEMANTRSVYHLYVVRLRNEARDSVCQALLQRGIGVGIHYPIALPNLKAYSHLGKEERHCPEATSAAQEILSLPLYPELKTAEVRYIVEALKKSYATRLMPVSVS